MYRNESKVKSRGNELSSASQQEALFNSPLSDCAASAFEHYGFNSIVDVLRHQATVQPDAIAFIHLLDGEDKEQKISYQELWARVINLSHHLQSCGSENQRVLMLFETGVDYIVGLFGIFLANAIAVPCFPPIGSRALERLGVIANDAQPNIVLTNSRFLQLKDKVLASLPSSRTSAAWVDLDNLSQSFAGDVKNFAISSQQIAIIQYTSGSTSVPKGVLLTHANLMSNCHSASIWMGDKSHRVGCSWLPPYHDMGLMGGILQPIYEGFVTVLLAPAHFVQRPSRWLRAISEYQVTVTIAPNFALDLCVDSISLDELSSLDLSSLEEVYCGAEPIRKASLDRFAAYFKPVGFAASSFGPCYGLAEATVFVSGKPIDTAPVVLSVDRANLALGQLIPVSSSASNALTLISSGRVAFGHRLVIVNPQYKTTVEDGTVGEIWVQGGNVGAGYWRKKALSELNFNARLAGQHGEFLRTGDLGALHDGEVYVTGRLKDLIIIAGRNFYPQDLEDCVQSADSRLRRNGIVAVGVDDGRGERLAIVAEVKRNEKLDQKAIEELRQKIVAAVVSHYSIAPSYIHLGPIGMIPLTTSGKLQRQATKEKLINDALPNYLVKSYESQ